MFGRKGSAEMLREKWNKDWKFWKDGDQDHAVVLQLPHDAMIHEKRDPAVDNGGATGFLPGGKYFYEKILDWKDEYKGKSLILEFEGIYMNSSVLLNGRTVGGRLYGYSGFFIEITGKLNKGKNVLTVIADNSDTPNSRWYSGSGIYRDVNFWIGGKNCIHPEGIKVKTVSTDPAVIQVRVDAPDVVPEDIRLTIIKDGEIVACGDGADTLITIPDASLWSAESPALYTVRAELVENGTVVDTAEDCFGIRSLSWSAKTGFCVNGKTVKLKGGCVHHDHGILGACAYEKAEYRRVKKLREMGFNAIRYAHNPAQKSFLRACDELGMYVVDESFDQWKVPQTAHDYALHFDSEWQKDVASLVSKDYNHPSVVMYCVGNEITDTGLPFGGAICKGINAAFKALDDSRPTLIAINSMLSTLANMKAKQAAGGKSEDVGSKEVNDIVALLPKIMASITPESLEEIIHDCVEAVDIVGYNYGGNLYAGTHLLAPDRVILSSETFPRRMADNWALVNANEYVIGDFHWTAWDYLGEAGVGLPAYGTTKASFSKPYPCLTAACGSFDLTGFPESAAFYAAILWGAYHKPYIGVRPLTHSGEEYTLGNWRFSDSIPCWTWNGYVGKIAQVEVFSEGAEVELFVNGVSVGKKTLEKARADFELSYTPGVLTAVSYNSDGAEFARTELASADRVTKLCVEPEDSIIKADGKDLAFIAVGLRDSRGVLKMTSTADITVSLEGPAKLLAFGSADPCAEPEYYSGHFGTYNGRALAVIQSTGESGIIRITASADGMDSADAEIESK